MSLVYKNILLWQDDTKPVWLKILLPQGGAPYQQMIL
jgi:hypothetical protein